MSRLTETTRVRRAVARHEARHALKALLGGVPTTGVSIDTRSLGRTYLGAASIDKENLSARFIAHGGIDTFSARPLAIAVISTLLVGYCEMDEGVRRWFPDLPGGRDAATHWPPCAFDAWGETTEQLAARMGHLNITDAEYDEAVVAALMFVGDPACRSAVEAIADALLERHDLTQDDVASIAAPYLSGQVVGEAETVTAGDAR